MIFAVIEQLLSQNNETMQHSTSARASFLVSVEARASAIQAVSTRQPFSIFIVKTKEGTLNPIASLLPFRQPAILFYFLHLSQEVLPGSDYPRTAKY